MSSPQAFIRVLQLARSNASQDLHISTDLLNFATQLLEKAEKGELSSEYAGFLAQELANRAVKLTEQSKELSTSINKIAGVL